ncbi:MAG: HAD-IC family P-type ATPase [candidate division Zixibacteria bacterium]|nr:HAD-IC family P-type ATPase [candidate division Zixibacteria bacterium]
MADNDESSSLNKPWATSNHEVLEMLGVDPEEGISGSEVAKRRKKYGKNILREHKKKSAWLIFIDQLKSPIVWLLAAAAVVSFAFSEYAEGLAVTIVIIINTAIGFFTELKAVRSMHALRKMGRTTAVVKRDGQNKEVTAEKLVVGDIVVIDEGDIVSADCRLLEASKLQSNESALTGESVPVAKSVGVVDETSGLSERENMIYKGTIMTRGSGHAVVVAVGMETELGKISELVEEAEEEETPLEERLHQLGHNLIWITLGIALLVSLLGIIRGKEILLMIETGIALAVAAIPEGLPIVATIALARGMLRMAKRNALINKLASVETLGATDVICTDKTGTLTENRMDVAMLLDSAGKINIGRENEHTLYNREERETGVDDDELLRDALRIGVLCNNASLSSHEKDGENRAHKHIGDPTEVALLTAGAEAGFYREQLVEEMPEKREEAFDTDTKMMATFHKDNGSYFVAVKGAPEAVLDACSKKKTAEGEEEFVGSEKEDWKKRNEELAGEGLRMLAVASKRVDSTEVEPYENLTLIGLMGLKDPPRKDIRHALELCGKAGLDVVMVTGDQPPTALNIAKSVNLVAQDYDDVIIGKELKPIDQMDEEERGKMVETRIFSRVSPKQKLDLISVHQDNGSIVAMTGDGVNDAPALKKADIGIAMGQRGTQAAREAADMVLKDDAFSSIVTAIEQGRVIFDNIRKFMLYLLSGNAGEIMIVGSASIAGLPLPLKPLQILFLNLLADVFPALALGVGGGDEDIMDKPPRKSSEPVLTRWHWIQIGVYGLILNFAVLAAFVLALYYYDMDVQSAVTVSFLTLSFGRILHVFNARDTQTHLFINEVTRNRLVWGALLLCTVILIGAIYIPPIAEVLQLTVPNTTGWLLIAAFSLPLLLIGQTAKYFGYGKI